MSLEHIGRERVAVEKDNRRVMRRSGGAEPPGGLLAKNWQSDFQSLGPAMALERHDFVLREKLVLLNRVIHPLLVAESLVFTVVDLDVGLAVTNEIVPNMCLRTHLEPVNRRISADTCRPVFNDHEIHFRPIGEKVDVSDDHQIHIHANQRLAGKPQKVFLKGHEFIPIAAKMISWKQVRDDAG
jgi:hypothetical protein